MNSGGGPATDCGCVLTGESPKIQRIVPNPCPHKGLGWQGSRPSLFPVWEFKVEDLIEERGRRLKATVVYPEHTGRLWKTLYHSSPFNLLLWKVYLALKKKCLEARKWKNQDRILAKARSWPGESWGEGCGQGLNHMPSYPCWRTVGFLTFCSSEWDLV